MVAVYTGLSFDEWRASYDTLDDEEHVSFARECVSRFPDQGRIDLKALKAFFDTYAPRDTKRVVEVGGHDGTAASHMLKRRPGIEWWVNVEIAPVNQILVDDRYALIPAKTFRWWTVVGTGRRALRYADVAVLSHVLEHLKTADIDALLTELHRCRAVYAECPIGDEPRDWAGYDGTHILEVGWRGLNDLFAEHGFFPEKLTDEAYAYRRDHHHDRAA